MLNPNYFHVLSNFNSYNKNFLINYDHGGISIRKFEKDESCLKRKMEEMNL